MLVKEVQERFYSTFEEFDLYLLNMVYKASQSSSKHFIQTLLPVITENKTPFTIEYIKSNSFKAMIVETYIECMMIMQATLRNEDIDDVVNYIYKNPVKSSPFVKMIQDKVLNEQDHNKELISNSSKDLNMPTSQKIERLETAKTYLQRPVLIGRLDTLEDKTISPRKIKI